MKVEELDWISRVGRSTQTDLAGFFAKTGLCTPKTKARGEEGSKEPEVWPRSACHWSREAMRVRS